RLNPRIRINAVVPLGAQALDRLVRERLLAWLAGAFGALAVVLATIGLYGIISYMVASRRGEIGIRMALGATRWRVVWLVLRQMAILMAAGLGLRPGASFALSGAARSPLYG